ncbi:exocyst complex component Sec6 [Microthyrium microscopicum]|uniref:Exocyst complex component Sec6 n=1 Tax=Microthyrium microscopicum TaxID=703497 RepID=A0A6A6UAC4_9PEZI|nr:exocyst complex component Sec6 [Microthyrium microscopicum]
MRNGIGETVNVKLAELLRNPDDLDKIPTLKAEFTRKKAAVDGQLRIGLEEQLNVTQAGMTSISDGQRTVELIKTELQKIDKLCAEAQTLITDFPHINLVSTTHRNFSLVENMRKDVEEFDQRLDVIERLLDEDDQDMENQPNLLAIHHELTKLRDVKDSAMDQVSRAGESAEELINNLRLATGATVQEYFGRLDQTVDRFDDHIGVTCMNLIGCVEDNPGLVVRLALIIEEEEKSDKKARALQDARQEYRDLAGRFESITTNQKGVRGYKEKFLKCIELHAEPYWEETTNAFQESPDNLFKILRWWFNDLNTVKLGMTSLMPKKWKIFQTYAVIYHRMMHDWLIQLIDDPELRPPQMLSIVNWSDNYYEKTKKLGLSTDWQVPHLIDDRAGELIREYRQLIIKAVDEWMDRMARTDTISFQSREENALDQDEYERFRTKTMADMWRMLAQQLEVARSSDREDIVEGVVDAMFRALQNRQRMWEKLIDQDLANYQDANASQDGGYQGFQDWLIAIANDQIACIDDDAEGGLGYLTRFSQDVQQYVSDGYWTKSITQLEALKDGYVDLSTHCLGVFSQLIFAIDFKILLAEFFTPTWYTKLGMKQAMTTFEDYLNDYRSVLHPSLHDILATELSTRMLVAYLGCVRNKGVKFRRSDPFNEKFRDDISTVFDFFSQFTTFDVIRDEWRVIEGMVDLVAEEKANIPNAYQAFKERYWDVGMSWVEAVLKSRDDYERSMLNGVKARAAEMEVVRGEETVMSKVK